MTFREILEHVIGQTPGAQAGAIMGTDGIPIEEYAVPGSDLELDTLTIEFSAVLEQLRKVSGSVFGADDGLEEIVLSTRDHQLLFRPIDEDYLFVVALEPLGMVGKARYLVRGVMEQLRDEL
jgi:predicted regulator of Ras-like GTPase activity (Roadblock/LC7/MglB family)